MFSVLSLVLFAATIYSMLPTSVWGAIASNCCSGNGYPRLRYVVRELGGLVCLFGEIFLLTLLGMISLVTVGTLITDTVPLSVITRAVQVEETAFLSQNAATYSGDTLALIWSVSPLLCSIAFLVVAASFHFFCTGYQRAVSDFANREFDRELRRTHRRYLRDNPQAESTNSVIV